jgi:uncharacterized protein (DUF1800 family)
MPSTLIIHRLGQTLMGAPPPTGWPEVSEGIVSAGGMLTRFRVAKLIAAGLIDGAEIDREQWETIARGRGTARLVRHILHGRVSGDTRRALRAATREDADAVTRAGLVLSSPEFQQQ